MYDVLISHTPTDDIHDEVEQENFLDAQPLWYWQKLDSLLYISKWKKNNVALFWAAGNILSSNENIGHYLMQWLIFGCQGGMASFMHH